MAHLQVDEQKLLSAFRKLHGFETQLTTVIDERAKVLDKAGQIDTLYWILKEASACTH